MNLRLSVLIAAVALAGCAPDMEPGRQKVKELLKDPESAQFKNERVGKSPALFCGEVNSKNSMGGYVGYKRYIVMPNFAAIDGNETAVLLQGKDEEQTAAREERVRKLAQEMFRLSDRKFAEDEQLRVMLAAIFQERWETLCVD